MNRETLEVFLKLKSCPIGYLKNPGLRCKFSIHVGTEGNPKKFGTPCKSKSQMGKFKSGLPGGSYDHHLFKLLMP